MRSHIYYKLDSLIGLFAKQPKSVSDCIWLVGVYRYSHKSQVENLASSQTHKEIREAYMNILEK